MKKHSLSNPLIVCLLGLLFLGGSTTMQAQTIVCRYVSPTRGAFTNGGTSWDDAKNNLQNAIDDVYETLGEGDKAYIFVEGSEEGTEYVPSRRATDDADGSVFSTSFRIYAGIYVFGGFKGDETPADPLHPELLPKQRIMTNGETYAEVESDINADKIGQTVRRWNFKYKTILQGNHSTSGYTFHFDANRGIYNISYPMSSYHVVWFATNGKIIPDPDGDESEMTGHFAALSSEAVVDGCTIEGGYASSTKLTGHEHTGFGGGVYMVKNAVLRNCTVHHCSAMQRGGAVYLDGGGEVERCYIHTSQATGYGMQQGYGGGVCIDYDGAVKHSYIIQCAARIGAGVAICHVPDEYPEETVYPDPDDRADPYTPFTMATVIANCTSNAEGAGVYLDEGGTLNHCSVVNNKCIGPDVIYYGRRHGRTGGIYVRNGGTIYNTVAWGNECAVNNDVQFAAFKEGSKRIHVYHSAFSKSDITDWAAATKEGVVSLENDNFPTPGYHSGNFPMFNQPTANAGIQAGTGGVVDPTQTDPGQPYQRVYNWHPLAASGLRGKAVQVTDAQQGISDEILHAHTNDDVVGRKFESISSCGALAHSYRNIQYSIQPSVEYIEGRAPGETDNIPTIYVDPTLVTAGSTNDDVNGYTGYLDNEPMGASWTHPMNNLPDAIYFFKQKLKDTRFDKDEYEGNTYYCFCEGNVHDPSKHYPRVQVLVKEGVMNVSGQGSYVSGSTRTASIRPGSNMRLYGGYPSTNTGTSLDERNPRVYDSDLTADLLLGGFDSHSVHVVAIANQHDVIVDGFRLFAGNANIAPAPDGDPIHAPEEWKMYSSLADGAGIVVNNAMSAADKRRDMTGNILRNCVIANCAAPEGAAVYVSGGYEHSSGGRFCKAELTIVNTIVRNCTAGDIYGNPERFVEKPNDTPATIESTLAGIITANGNGKIWTRNCDIVNNCGFPFKCDSTLSVDKTRYISGNIEVYNTVVFSNGLRIHSDHANISSTVFAPKESWYKVSGQYIFMGYDVLFPSDIVDRLATNHIYRILTHNRNEDRTILHTRIDDGSQEGQWGTDASTEVRVQYPVFVNPSRNVGHTTGNDQSYYGGKISYEPLPTNPIVNAANPTMDTGTGILPDNSSLCMSYDMDMSLRDYGGDPDVGAIESQRLPKAGTVLYVTPDGAGRRDGSSWANAIQGNAIYALSGGAAGSDEIDPQNGARITNTDPTIGSLPDGGVPTTDDRYCGFARSWFKERRTGATTTTTVTDTWTIERYVYDDGERAGEADTIRNDATPTQSTSIVINNEGVAEGGFTSGWADDERYPYGELSGQSRAFWRATGNYTPIPEWWLSNSFKSTDTKTDSYTGETVTGIGGGTFEELLDDPTRGIKIQNNRTESYVSGLQYAVERAAAYNALGISDPGRIAGIDSMQVWVSNGTYTDYKGFIVRDNTTVLGSFPAKDGGTPGLNERHTLLSSVIDIPKSQAAQELNPDDYETILQISEVNPLQDNEHINLDAVKHWDDDYAKLTGTNTTTYAYKTHTITHHFSYYDTSVRIDKTDEFVQYSNSENGSASVNVWTTRTSTTDMGGIRYITFGTATADKDCWHLSVPTDNVGKRFGASNGNGGNIYENNVYKDAAGQRAWIRDGSLTDVNIWQTLKNVPAGGYILTIDLAAFYYDTYKNLNGNKDNPNTNVTLQVLNASDNVLASTPISYYSGRNNMNRYTLSFNQAATGNVTVKIVVGPGLDRDGNVVEDDYSKAMNQNPNRREINIDNLKLYQLAAGESYTENTTALTNEYTDKVVPSPLPDEVSSGTAYDVTKHRTTLRKRVLQMPDKTNPVYGGGGYMGDPTQQAGTKLTGNADYISHSERVNDSRRKANSAGQFLKRNDPDFEWYTDAIWDGFTIRHGFIHDFAMCHGGGAGVSIYEGAHLKDCVIIDNISACERMKGGGVFVDGSTSSVEGCFILGNSSTRSDVKPVEGQIFAGGMFIYEGTCYNTLIANNHSLGNGGGLGLCVGKFYNNTLAYNTCGISDGGGGLRIAKDAVSYILMANSIIYGNSGLAISMTESATYAPFLHCYIQSQTAISNTSILNAIMAPNGSTDPDETEKRSGGRGWKNKFMNGVSPSLATTPFEADVDNSTYTGDALTYNDYRLRKDYPYCINKGTEDFGSTMYNALERVGTANIPNNSSYQIAYGVELPPTDVAFADRIQDCQVDIGAYEFDGTLFIEPTLFPNETPKKAVFYVTQNGSGMATAETPANAACSMKLQKVLDAAGRWRYASYKYADDEDQTQQQNNFDTDILRNELKKAGVAADINAHEISEELPNLKDYEVIVRLEGENGSGFSYIPTRSTNINTENINELEKSLIVPHGIRIEGGFEAGFTNERDILGRPTRFSGEITNTILGTTGNVYHVVTFTNTLFDIDEQPFQIDDGSTKVNLTDQLDFLGDTETYDGTDSEKQAAVNRHRTVLNGLFIQDGEANGTSSEHRIGAAAVVTEYAHLSNCVIMENSSADYGGGLYLEPRALVSGCIVKNNSAKQGGGLYVEEPEHPEQEDGESDSDYQARLETWQRAHFVHIISTTVVDNTATQNAGGLWFGTNLRANSSAFWRNTASDYGNVAGTFSTGKTQVDENYPMNYCGVGSNRVAGVNNIELPPLATQGVRWNPFMPYEEGIGYESLYFPITSSSVLGRSGMTYPAYEAFREQYPTLELTDIFGLNRLAQAASEDMTLADGSTFTKEQKNNAFIEMGARVLNGNFEVNTEFTHVMTRLFVTTTERLPTEAALEMQMNTVSNQWAIDYPGEPFPSDEFDSRYIAVKDKVDMYKQMGSSFLNPFHRLGDALEYIIKVRKEMTENYDVDHTIGEYYKNVRFEVFVCGGTYYPFRDVHGHQGESRTNTFVIPEEVSLIGGVNHEASGHAFCQETDRTVPLNVAGYTLNGASTHEIRTTRGHSDYNGNHVKEPWEMTEQTILSGHAIHNDMKANVYHVITCFADKDQVGQLPSRYTAGGTTAPEMFTGINPKAGDLLANIEPETQESRDKRTIIIDGMTITGGYANNIDDADEASNFQKLTYFRGGGILVEGNWDNSFNDKTDLPEVLGVPRRNIPLMLTSCIIKDNTAGNGGGVYTNGTFYAFSCHFTKNLAIGPITAHDQLHIPWTAGGAIANNYECHLWNSLFDNNEARRGLTITNTTITNADERQGYGGAISCSETGLARIGNCDFVRNKAVAFPALYNFIDNNLRAASTMLSPGDPNYYGKGWHFAVNTIFWGNQATGSTVARATGWEDEYYTALYGTPDYIDRREPWHIANFAPRLDVATLTFCSYEQGTGREGTVWYANHDNAKSAPLMEKGGKDGLTRLYAGDFEDVLDEYFGYFPDGSPSAPYFKKDGGKELPCAKTYDHIWWDDPNDSPDMGPQEIGSLNAIEQQMAVTYNYNLVLETENHTPGGPYFVRPSLEAGVDGYMETSDWLVSRLNNTIDTGWGFLCQRVSQESATSGLYTTVLQKGPDKEHLSDRTPLPSPVTESDLDEQYNELYGWGFYNIHARDIYNRFKDIGYPNLMPIGDDYYMEYSREDPDGVKTENMRRISTHPKMGVQDVFIDMGIYEYQYVQLVTPGDEVDVIWVAETQNEGVTCDGSTWYRATSDLQGAIETLLLSRNDHDKVIKLKSGNYSPHRLTDSNYKSFFVNIPSKQDGVMLPRLLQADQVQSVKSLSFRGGYPTVGADEPLRNYESDRDIQAYPVTFTMSYEIGNTEEQMSHLFIIEDAQKKGTFANYLEGKNPEFMEEVTPIVFDGITFANPYGHSHDEGGAALLYKEQFQIISRDNEEVNTTYHLKPDPDGSPKLLVKDCTFMTSGKCEKVSAVSVMPGGGEALFVNSVFHSNSGNPIEGANTKMVNCTFALDGGHIKLEKAEETYSETESDDTFTSGVYNSIIWLDDEAHTGADKKLWEGYIDMGTPIKNGGNNDDTEMKHNAFTEWQKKTSDPDTYGWYYPIGLNVIYGTNNIRLSPENDDVLFGPNFIDPKYPLPDGLSEPEALAMKQARDFRLNGSARTINQADAATYKAHVPFYAETSTEEEKTEGEGLEAVTYYFHSLQRSNPSTLTDEHLQDTDPTDPPYTERERDYQPRWNGPGIDRGAYECKAAVQRVLYVMDGPTGKRNGTTWEHAFDIEELQRAIDMASVYHLTSSLHERAYVFVRSTSFPVTPLKLRDGVSVYGGATNVLESVETVGDNVFTDENIDAYIHKMTARRDGIATKNMSHNITQGLISDNVSEYDDGFLLDGFWITGGETEQTAVNLVKENTVVRNVVITGNTVTTAGQPVVNVTKGLLYNTLLYGNTAGSGGATVNVGENGYVLNCTVVPASGQTGLSGETGSTHVQNTINAESSTIMFAPYRRPLDKEGNTGYAHTLPTYLTDWEPYWYQLHERSTEIDAGIDDNGAGVGSTAKDGGNTIAKAFADYVDFTMDRDVLGNPRRLRGRVDNGCFETWRITGDKHITNETNAAFTTNYGGHLYPHIGSVLYLDEDANLVVQTDGGTPRFTSSNDITPGYVLLGKGASIYGQGNTLNFDYVAAEKQMGATQQYALMAFPFTYHYNDVLSASYAAGALTETPEESSIAGAYSYDGDARSNSADPGYHFRDNDAERWTSMAERVEACNGWMLHLTTPAEKTLRFTGWATDADKAKNLYAYSEDGSDKTVRLTQYNSNMIGAYTYPEFTRLEDMGWNLKGQPWLVAQFATDGTNPDFQMDVPHLFYSMAGDGTYIKAVGELYTSRSWDGGSVVNIGDAFFTQTAIVGEYEDLTFKLPTFGDPTEAPVKPLVAIYADETEEPSDDTHTTDFIELHPSIGADIDMPYRLGSDGIKWFAFDDEMPQFYATNEAETPFSLLSAAPVETDIPLGVAMGQSSRLRIALPSPEAFADYGHVWLTDHEQGTVTDLMTRSYTLSDSPYNHTTDRLTLRIGGPRPPIGFEEKADYTIFTRRNELVVRGLSEGDLISIYTVGGALMERVRAKAYEYTRTLPNGIYIVRVGNTVKKLEAYR